MSTAYLSWVRRFPSRLGAQHLIDSVLCVLRRVQIRLILLFTLFLFRFRRFRLRLGRLLGRQRFSSAAFIFKRFLYSLRARTSARTRTRTTTARGRSSHRSHRSPVSHVIVPSRPIVPRRRIVRPIHPSIHPSLEVEVAPHLLLIGSPGNSGNSLSAAGASAAMIRARSFVRSFVRRSFVRSSMDGASHTVDDRHHRARSPARAGATGGRGGGEGGRSDGRDGEGERFEGWGER